MPVLKQEAALVSVQNYPIYPYTYLSLCKPIVIPIEGFGSLPFKKVKIVRKNIEPGYSSSMDL